MKYFLSMAQWCFGDRPAEELYDLAKDPNELKNVAADAAYAEVRQRMARDLEQYLRDTGDPRVIGKGAEKFDTAPRYNSKNKSGRGDKKTKKK